MVRLIIAAIALIATVTEAFSPMNTSNPAARKVELARAKVQASNPTEYKTITDGMQMVSGGAQAEEYYEGVRIGPPPDLPSLLLHNRIVYIGMPLVPAVTELIIAELLYLNYESTTDPITMYINSSGTTTAQGQQVGFETEAFAIADVMKYVRPPVHTVALGQAFGAAAMLLSQGKRGKRSALPNATIMLNQPRSQSQGQATDIAIKARETMHNRRTMCNLIATGAQKPLNVVEQDCSRTKYLQPHEAVEYGLIDRVLESESSLPVKPSFIQQLAN
uniref:ATP-dependent Clp protease proteolytic subunit n=1 Tax=Chaetoceros debilis TaxID=122233 RepID=A0A7S3Q4T4_9STRA|mmetsp:Transcript_9657/g.14471  ORF Transcript_9657/g.14471 Transcript_9657/m.14471 type:complete len:276 (-) Transcript_9657:369-1196(-)|eukprot:CAMPEP_0194074564 /NCGR_PEP_ID=MMETSP0149-20130528/1656_1 /TAXON_ID=122233 /ORGANISM="Chaetoceros debilis, Strain MM31A-1" /LENGTH=275 /DNA_ID=CAMNT_0038754775 /DNA_START=112 /DNA_END=939 /DNA_ORIENTATION=-